MSAPLRVAVWIAVCATLAKASFALTVEDAILYVLESNPEIKAAEANKQAIEFELDQARSFWAPRVELEGRSEASLTDGDRVPDLTA
ncbi:MAG: TolC family protein, partial [Pseudomonadota bacterium]